MKRNVSDRIKNAMRKADPDRKFMASGLLFKEAWEKACTSLGFPVSSADVVSSAWVYRRRMFEIEDQMALLENERNEASQRTSVIKGRWTQEIKVGVFAQIVNECRKKNQPLALRTSDFAIEFPKAQSKLPLSRRRAPSAAIRIEYIRYVRETYPNEPTARLGRSPQVPSETKVPSTVAKPKAVKSKVVVASIDTERLARVEATLAELLELVKVLVARTDAKESKKEVKPLYQVAFDAIKKEPVEPPVRHNPLPKQEHRLQKDCLRCVIIGSLSRQTADFRSTYPDVKFRFYSSDKAHPDMTVHENEYVLIMTSFVDHSTEGFVKSKVSADRLIRVNGAMSSVHDAVKKLIALDTAAKQDQTLPYKQKATDHAVQHR